MSTIYNNQKYIRLAEDNILKFVSFENAVYFTLRDIYINMSSKDILDEIQLFYKTILPIDNTKHFTDILDDKKFLRDLYQILSYITIDDFDFNNSNYLYTQKDMENFILFDEWWKQFELLKYALRERIYT